MNWSITVCGCAIPMEELAVDLKHWAVLRECGHEPLQFYWFRSAVKLFNSMLNTNSDILRRVVQADLNLQPRSSACWTAQLLSAFQGLRGCELVTAYAHYARTPVLQLKQRTEDFSATLKNVSCNKMKFSVSET